MAGIVGVVLAGGRSTRFGSEKAVAVVDGAPMIARVVAVLARGCDRVAVNAPEPSGAAAWARANGLEVLPDPAGLPDGPLAGVLAGLVWARSQGAETLATAPCDTPRLPAPMVARLRAALGDAAGAYVVTDAGEHPLCALWRVDLGPELERRLAAGHPAVRGWLREIDAAAVPFSDERAFANLNGPSDRAARQVTKDAARRI